MDRHLVLSVHLHDRYHGIVEGSSEWPPSPARLFQALLAAAARGAHVPDDALAALDWLERAPAPVIAAPQAAAGQRIALYVPNNDADSLGDPTDLAGIRTRKLMEPRLPAHPVLHYAWPLRDSQEESAEAVIRIAEGLYQLGRGVDMAWAHGTVMDHAALASVLERYKGTIYRPSESTQHVLACPAPGSLESLRVRHAAPRLQTQGTGRRARSLYTNAPKPWFVGVGYAPEVHRRVYELRDASDDSRLHAARPGEVLDIVTRLRDAAAARLREALPEHEESIERALIGRKADGRDGLPPEHRIRILPLPSIGHEHADLAVRRIVVEVPSGAPIAAPDVWWALSGLHPVDLTTGEIDVDTILTPSMDHRMADRYLARGTRWQTVTPAALPALRRRIEPTRIRDEAKAGGERAAEEAAARVCVRAALRHAGIDVRAREIHVQREPWIRRGSRAEAFACPPRFPKERLWHVAIDFEEAVDGPLVIGDGRFLGLGLMAPVRTAQNAWIFEVEGPVDPAQATLIARALRRATMSRWARVSGRRTLPAWISGHSDNGKATSDPEHLAFACDATRRRLLVIPPHAFNRRAPWGNEGELLAQLADALEGLTELRAGGAGILHLKPMIGLDEDDTLLRPSRTWVSVTPYVVDRHRRLGDAAEAVRADVLAACMRQRLPIPEVDVSDARSAAGRGLMAHVRLCFKVAVAGPILLGRERYLGGGLFESAD